MMKRDVSIFIAGAINETLREREYLKVLANDISSDYRQKDIRVHAMSYKNFDDKQVKYNDFIENEADIVIFILKGCIRANTQAELELAARAYWEKKLPEIIVFLDNSSMTETVETGRIYGLMEGLLGKQYPVSYKTLDELRAEAKERIDRFIHKRMDAQSERTSSDGKNADSSEKDGASQGDIVQSDSKATGKQVELESRSEVTSLHSGESSLSTICKIKQSKLMWVLGVLAICFAFLFLWKTCIQRSEPTLVLAGGGSVAQFIKETDSVNVDEWPNSIYLRMSSSKSWTLLSEEVNRTVLVDQQTENKFYPICLSASEASVDDFIKACTKEEFSKHATVVSYYLGEDPLVLYVSDQLYESIKDLIQENIVTPEILSYLVNEARESHLQILRTTEGSGTLLNYQHYMSEKDSIFVMNDDSTMVFNEISNMDIITNKEKFMVMGSQYYKMQKLENNVSYNIHPLRVCDANKSNIQKPMFLYFVAYYDKLPDTGPAWIPDPIMQFLQEMNIPQEIWKNRDLWDPDSGHITANGKIIVHLRERPKDL